MTKSGWEHHLEGCLCGATTIWLLVSSGQPKKHGISWTLTPRSHLSILLPTISVRLRWLGAECTTQTERLKHSRVSIQAQAGLSLIIITTQPTLMSPLLLQSEQSKQLVIRTEQMHLNSSTLTKMLSPSIILSTVIMVKRSRSLRMKRLLECMVTTRKVKLLETLVSLSRLSPNKTEQLKLYLLRAIT